MSLVRYCEFPTTVSQLLQYWIRILFYMFQQDSMCFYFWIKG